MFPSVFFIISYSFPSFSLPPGGVTVLSCSVPVVPAFLVSFFFPSVFLPPAVVGSVRFCARLPGFPSFFFFPSLLVSFSFLISFFPRAGGGWSLFCYCCVVVFPSFLFPLSLLLSSFPGGGGNVLF